VLLYHNSITCYTDTATPTQPGPHYTATPTQPGPQRISPVLGVSGAPPGAHRPHLAPAVSVAGVLRRGSAGDRRVVPAKGTAAPWWRGGSPRVAPSGATTPRRGVSTGRPGDA